VSYTLPMQVFHPPPGQSCAPVTHPHAPHSLRPVVLMDQGGLMKDIADVVLVVDTVQGATWTDAAALDKANATETNGPWEMTFNVYTRSVGSTRLVMTIWFFLIATWRAVAHPDQCNVLRNSARRSLVLDDADRAELDDTSSSKRNSIQLDAESERAVGLLHPDDEVVVLVPRDDFVLTDGPSHSLLCYLCGDADMAKRINDYMEGEALSGLRGRSAC